GEAESVVSIAGSVIERSGLEKALFGLIVLARFVVSVTESHPSDDATGVGFDLVTKLIDTALRSNGREQEHGRHDQEGPRDIPPAHSNDHSCLLIAASS